MPNAQSQSAFWGGYPPDTHEITPVVASGTFGTTTINRPFGFRIAFIDAGTIGFGEGAPTPVTAPKGLTLAFPGEYPSKIVFSGNVFVYYHVYKPDPS